MGIHDIQRKHLIQFKMRLKILIYEQFYRIFPLFMKKIGNFLAEKTPLETCFSEILPFKDTQKIVVLFKILSTLLKAIFYTISL